MMQELAEQIAGLVGAHVPEDRQEPFMDELRRHVAETIRALAEQSGRGEISEQLAQTVRPTPTTKPPAREKKGSEKKAPRSEP